MNLSVGAIAGATSRALDQFDVQLDQLFGEAIDRRPLETSHFAFGSLRLRVEHPAGLFGNFLSAMDFARTGGGEPSLTVRMFDASGGLPLPHPTWPRSRFGPRCDVRDNDRLVEMRTWLGILHTYSVSRRLGYYWFRDAARLWWWEATFPLRQFMHWHGIQTAFQSAHAGAVGTPEGGVLIAGKSGSGKTTSTLSCLESELRYAGDDYLLLEEKTDTGWHVHTLYNTAKVNAEDLGRFPGLAPHCTNRGRLPRQKAIFNISECRPGSLIAGFPLKAILVPRITGLRETTLEPAPPQAAMMAIAPTSILQFAGGGRSAFRKFARLSRRVPAYYLNAGTDLRGIPRAITRFLETSTA